MPSFLCPHTSSLLSPTPSLSLVSPKTIALHYLQGWFFFDLVASIPLYLIFGNSSGRKSQLTRLARLPRLLRLLKMLRLFSLLRLMRLGRYVDRLQFTYELNVGFIRIGNFIFWFLAMNHFVTCIWIYLATSHSDIEDTWIAEEHLTDSADSQLYLIAAYWSLSTLTSVGYGDVHAGNNAEYIFSIITMIIGVSFYSYAISNISSILAAMFNTQSQQQDQVRCHSLSFLLSFLLSFFLSLSLSLSLLPSLLPSLSPSLSLSFPLSLLPSIALSTSYSLSPFLTHSPTTH